MSVYSPSRQKRRVFLMEEEGAEYYYNQYLSKFGHAYIKRCFLSGARTVCPHNDIQIWGENISDNELFLKQLIGTVDQEPLVAILH